jgi:DNA-binding transcriptional ArsR family regulator
MLKYQLAALDEAFHALSEPARRVMVERLSRGPASVSELARPLPMTLSAVMQHLAVLEASGLVSSKKVGRVRTCSLETKGMDAAWTWFTERRAAWERDLDRLEQYLAESEDETKPKNGDRS